MNLTSPAVEAALQRFEGFNPTERLLTLDRLDVVLETLGNPQDHLPPVIHVAGTNGKGSTTAFMRAMAEAAGLRVHVSTSPHLVRFNERIRLAGKLVEDDALIAWLDRVHEAVQGRDITHFEACQAAAFLAFSEIEADLLILEVGLGGRFDASNVIDACAVSVITPIDFDHMQFLGNTLTAIASDKAGILKPGCPAVSAIQAPEARAAIQRVADDVKAPLSFLNASDIAAVNATPRLRGSHQFANAALAARALQLWDAERFTPSIIETGIRSAVWPARMQQMGDGPVTRLANGAPVWLDGGHNPHAARAISNLLDDLDAETDRAPTMLVAAMLATKDAEGFFRELSRPGLQVFTIPIADNELTETPEALAAAAEAAGLKATPCLDLEAAMKKAVDAGAGRLLICGSLYLAGHVLALNGEIPD